MAENKTQTKDAAAQEAHLQSNVEARNEAAEKVLAEQLEQQAEARPGDVIPEGEAPVRAAHSAEGGGAWPPELLTERGVTPHQPVLSTDPALSYTSHEK